MVDGRPSRKDRKVNRELEQEAAKEEGAVVTRNWWGHKKRKVKRNISTSSRGDNPVQAVTDSAGKHEVAEKQGPDRTRTEYDEAPRTTEDGFVYGSKGSPGWKSRHWEDLKVGDFVKLTNNEAVPAGKAFWVHRGP